MPEFKIKFVNIERTEHVVTVEAEDEMAARMKIVDREFYWDSTKECLLDSDIVHIGHAEPV